MTSEVLEFLWSFISFGTCIGWVLHMGGYATSGKRLTSVLKGS